MLVASGLSPAALVRSCFGGVPGHPVYIGIDHIDGVCALLSGDRGGEPIWLLTAMTWWPWNGDLAGGRDIDSPTEQRRICREVQLPLRAWLAHQ